MGLIVKRRVTLDLSKRGAQVTVPFSCGDQVAHEVIFTIRDGSEEIALPAGVSADVAVKNGYNNTGCVDNCTIDHVNNAVIYTPTKGALAVAGNIECTLHVFDADGAVIGAPTFIFAVSEGDNENTEDEVSKALVANPNWGIIAAADVNAQAAAQAKEDAEAARDAAVTAQGLAEGARDAAVIAKGDAVTAQGLAEGARDAAVIAQGLAEVARGAAVDAQGEAEKSATRAEENAALAEEYIKNVQETGKATEVVNETGNSRTAAMSQHGVTKAIFPFESLNDVTIINDDTLHQLFYPAPNTDIEISLVSNSQIATFTNKNLFYINPAISSGNGLTITKDFGYLKIVGTPEKEYKLGNAWVFIALYRDKKMCPAGHYKFSLGTTLPDGVSCQYAAYREDGTYESFTPANGAGGREILYDFYLNVILKIPVGQYVNLTIKPQLQRGHHLDEWVAPVRKEYELAGRTTTVIPSPGVSGYLFWKSAQICQIKYKSLLHMEQMLKDLMVELERKVYAITSGNYLYGTASNGAQAHYKVSTKATTGLSVVQRDASGRIELPEETPATGTNFAISRKNAEAMIAELFELGILGGGGVKLEQTTGNSTTSAMSQKACTEAFSPKVQPLSTGAWGGYYIKGDGSPALIPISNGVAGSTLAMRLPEGTLAVAEPTANNHATSKNYVDVRVNPYRHNLTVLMTAGDVKFHAMLIAYTKSTEPITTESGLKNLMGVKGKSTHAISVFGYYQSGSGTKYIGKMRYDDGAGYFLKCLEFSNGNPEAIYVQPNSIDFDDSVVET